MKRITHDSMTTHEVALEIFLALIRHHGCDDATAKYMVRLSCDLTEMLSEECQDRR